MSSVPTHHGWPLLTTSDATPHAGRSRLTTGRLFALRVVGGSMIDPAICSGNYVAVQQSPTVRHGDIVAILGQVVAVMGIPRPG
ncbi:LexA family protein [Streptomyces sp. NPDC058011]|uniref:LexA family protein n=1 Tax=Streptomyces sp. NPDC058011 TaxID=3346305 RepID=UPI0036F0B6EF